MHSYDGIYHIYDAGKMMRTLGDYVDAGADVVETLTPPPVGDVDLAEAKRLYGDRTCLKGYVDLLYVLQIDRFVALLEDHGPVITRNRTNSFPRCDRKRTPSRRSIRTTS